jgi:acetolactate synthase-1/2/3 large subunit
MTTKSGGQLLAEALAAEGVQHVFGIAGTHNCALFDGLLHTPSIQPVTVRHEQGAAMMAAGYARASGRVAACFVVPGPGLTNALTGMGQAYSESAPLLMVAGQNALPQLDREGAHFHELQDSLAVARAVSGYTARVASAAELPRAVREAFRLMHTRRPRPAYIEVPLDVQTARTEAVALPVERYVRAGAEAAAIARAVDVLSSARRPFIFAGGGVESADAVEALARVAQRLRAPVVTSVFGRGAISDRHPLALGDGWGRLPLYQELLEQADAVLVVGSRIDVVSDVDTGGRFPSRIVQIDIDPMIVGQRRPVEVGIVADARAALEALAASLPAAAPPACWFDLEGFRARKRAWLEERAGPVLDIIDQLRASLPDDAIVVDDLTLVGYWIPVAFETYQPRTSIHPGTYGTLGYALPAAIGAKLACPDRPVVSISGDGGFLFSLQELATARALNLDLVNLVFNDQAFGAIRTFQDRVFGGRHVGVELANPDFVRLGEAFGVNAARVPPEGVGRAVREARERGGVWLIEVPFAPAGSVNMVPWMP